MNPADVPAYVVNSLDDDMNGETSRNNDVQLVTDELVAALRRSPALVVLVGDAEVAAFGLAAATEREMATWSAALAELPASEVGQRYVASMRLAALEGGDGGEQRRARAAHELAGTYEQGLAALRQGQLPMLGCGHGFAGALCYYFARFDQLQYRWLIYPPPRH